MVSWGGAGAGANKKEGWANKRGGGLNAPWHSVPVVRQTRRAHEIRAEHL